jgi:hypothetical protein
MPNIAAHGFKGGERAQAFSPPFFFAKKIMLNLKLL